MNTSINSISARDLRTLTAIYCSATCSTPTRISANESVSLPSCKAPSASGAPAGRDRLTTTGWKRQQAFVDLKFGDEAKFLTLRAGRHEMDFGSGRLISAGEGLNVRRSFDGVRVIYRQGRWLVNGQVNKLVSIKRGLFNDGPDWSQTFWGVGATRPRPKMRGGLQFAYIGLDRKEGRFDQGSGRELRHTVIARAFGASDNTAGLFDYNFDTIFQWGTFMSAGREIDIRAWALATDLGHTINRIPLKPRLGLRADATSGDRDPNDHGLQTFNPLFPGTAYSDTIGLIGAPNSLAFNPTLRFAVKRAMDGVCRNDLLLAAERARRDLRHQRRPAPHRATEPRTQGRNAAFRQTGLAYQPASHLHRDLLTLLRRKIPERDATGGGR